MPHIYGLAAPEEKTVAQAAALAQDTAAPHAAHVDENGRFPEEALAALASNGLLGLNVPSALGGSGHGPRAFVAVVEELAQACSSTAMIYVMHAVATQTIAAAKALEPRDSILREIAGGRHLTTLAFSEKGSRSQFWAPVSRLEARGPGYVTSAEKSWVTAAGHADSFVSTAQKPDAASPLESTLYLARKGARGLRVAAPFDGLGLRGNESAAMTFESLDVARGDLLTEPGQGADLILTVVLPWFAIGTAAMANGLSRAAVGLTARHLQDTGFEHTGSKLRDLPTLRERLARMKVRTEQARALLGHALGEIEQPSAETPLYVLETRAASLEAAVEVTDLAMKACGGAAFSRHLPLERIFRDARAGWIMAPTVDQLHDFLGRALTGLPLFG